MLWTNEVSVIFFSCLTRSQTSLKAFSCYSLILMYLVYSFWLLNQNKKSEHFYSRLIRLRVDQNVFKWCCTKVMKYRHFKNERAIQCPTIVAVWLGLMFSVGKGQDWIWAAGQAGTPPRWFRKPTVAPQLHGAFRWPHSLTVSIKVLGYITRETKVRQTHFRAERQATSWRWLVDSQLTKTEMLTWITNKLSSKSECYYISEHVKK